MAGALLGLGWTAIAAAGGGVTATAGWGPERFRSRTVYAEMPLSEARPWSAGLEYFDADTGAGSPVREYNLNLSGSPAQWLDLALTAGRTRDDQLVIDGAGVDAGLYLQRLWRGRWETRLDLGYGRNDYRLRTVPPQLAGRLHVPVQERVTAGLSQGLGEQISVYALRDEYSYDRDPRRAARFLVRRLRVPPNRVFFLLGFPDRTDTVGVSFLPSDRLALDLVHTDTRDVLGRHIRSLTLAPAYSWGTWSAALSASRVESGDREDLYMEVSVSYYP